MMDKPIRSLIETVQLRKDICVVFEMSHRPRLRSLSQEEATADVFDDAATVQELINLAHDVYIPVTSMLKKLVMRNTGVKIGFAASGSCLSDLKASAPAVIDAWRGLTEMDVIEWLAIPYNNSLSLLFSDEAFREEVTRGDDLVYEYFGVQPNTLLGSPVSDSSISRLATAMGFKALVQKVKVPIDSKVPVESIVLDENDLINVSIDHVIRDTIVHRFGAGDAAISIEEFIAMINRVSGDTVVVGLPIEVFKWHRDAGILQFFESFLSIAAGQNRLVSISQQIADVTEEYRHHNSPLSNSIASDHSPWLGNDIQRQAFMAAKDLDEPTAHLADPAARRALMKLLNVHHFINMSHSLAGLDNQYLSPQEAFACYMGALESLKRFLNNSVVREDDKGAKSMEAERQHPTTPAWALNEQSRYKENTHSHI
ncbi:hypothetical protein WBG78_15285 [Chryseolinea sp. T2]|uniref:hypothetical protein n=1 Tax=Chryseolinea sp. T2 TaxID=3129255 RepID=UPI003077078F